MQQWRLFDQSSSDLRADEDVCQFFLLHLPCRGLDTSQDDMFFILCGHLPVVVFSSQVFFFTDGGS